ncbi:MAG TPA: class IV adenylate cyclase [Candidatus Angelobacter sp.]|nr:class IV adenylate cyclase [Candidatus Angelobacter sp.]
METEVKFRIDDLTELTARLRKASIRLATPRTHEMNTLFDFRAHTLRKQGALLRVRKYGDRWTVTFKGKARIGRYKSRPEIETRVEDGEALTSILENTGFVAVFSYEKFRTEWTDGHGQIVVDETPIGNFGEIEGPGKWIEAVARQLHISPAQYITDSYGTLFQKWRRHTRSRAKNMCFAEVRP